MDEYLTCKEYEGHPRLTTNSDFSTFTKDGEFYFAMLNDDDTVAFKSQGYKSEAARDNGIASVITNREIEERFSIIEADGAHFVILKAGNHQEIARSCAYQSHAAAAAYLNPPKSPPPPRDEYLPCSEYAGYPRSSSNSRFSTFTKNGEYYFAMLNNDGEVVLKSQGYKSEAARDNGIASVETNRIIEERFSVQEMDGKYFVILKAANHQEIARSCPYDSHAAAMAFIKPPVVASAATTDARLDDYLACKMYKGHPRSEQNREFSTFEHDGEYYFALLDDDGEVLLRSEGYTTAKSRDNGIASVAKNRKIKEHFSVEQIRSYYFVVLKAGNNQEIGRSCPYTDRAAAVFPMGLVAAAAPIAAAASVPTPVVATPAASYTESAYKDDDGGGLGWLWWLLPLLALLLCLWCCRGCFGCGADPGDVGASKELPIIESAVDTIESEMATDTLEAEMAVDSLEEARLAAEAEAQAKAAEAEREAERLAEEARKKAEEEAYRGPKSSGY